MALNRLEVIFDAEPGTPEGDELELLSLLIDNYEKLHYPIYLPDPTEAIKFRMEQMNYKPKDLADVIGFRSRVTEILGKKRKLSLDMIRKIHKRMHISTDINSGILIGIPQKVKVNMIDWSTMALGDKFGSCT